MLTADKLHSVARQVLKMGATPSCTAIYAAGIKLVDTQRNGFPAFAAHQEHFRWPVQAVRERKYAALLLAVTGCADLINRKLKVNNTKTTTTIAPNTLPRADAFLLRMMSSFRTVTLGKM